MATHQSHHTSLGKVMGWQRSGGMEVSDIGECRRCSTTISYGVDGTRTSNQSTHSYLPSIGR
ncbi:hypothetical protein ASPCADRAFT_204924 [Aspergillus carbonarius ITEM 5010]|uniref:Uncharacterized protein n=1 Tax=Aspergillus carbonarius (strain ITEM 5010) TaxID=602072 RepID=A0A1R3RXT0_ASPC5|nr:hypothetical protein ASPCADRAFT_204924 [Aspergillus carbonarius ITEM 5010]